MLNWKVLDFLHIKLKLKYVKKHYLTIYITSLIFFISYEFISGLNPPALFQKALTFSIPLVICVLMFFLVPKKKNSIIFVYLLFFGVAITSFFGLTKTLTGFPVFASNVFTLGLPFYTAFFAFKLFEKKLRIKDIFIAANPLLLFTGPVAIKFIALRNTNIKRRFNQYFPFMVIGVFFFKIISTPLAQFLPMVEQTDVLSTTLFAFIFELFIYFNFAGLSLLVFGFFGILGVEIPLNFKQPFSSRNLVGYWKGWHLSLSVVLKNLFYKPFREFGFPIAILAVFISSALWHGISINFFYWGLFQAFSYILTVFLLKRNFKFWTPFIMIISVLFGRFLFLESDYSRFLIKLEEFCKPNLITPNFGNVAKNSYLSLFLGVVIVVSEFVFYKNKYFIDRTYKFLRIPLVQTILIILILFLISSNSGLNFAVYGQR